MSVFNDEDFGEYYATMTEEEKDDLHAFQNAIFDESFSSFKFIKMGTKRVWAMYPELAQKYSNIVEKFKLFRNN